MNTKELLLTTCTSVQQFAACLWDHSSANVIHQYKNGGKATSNGLALLDKDYVLTADAERPVLNVWTLNGHEPSKDARLVLPGQATCLCVCPFSVYLAVGVGRKLHVWHLSSGKLITVQQKHYQPISVIKFSSDGIYLSVGGEDGGLVTYNFTHLVGFQNKEEAAEPLYSKSDHSRAITGLHVGTFGGKARLASISVDQACFMYSLVQGEMLASLAFQDQLSALVLSDTSWNMFVGTYSGDIYQIKLTDPPRQDKHHVDKSSELSFVGHKQKVSCLAVNFDSSMLVSGSVDCMVHVWQIRSRKILKSIEHKGAVTNLLFVLNYDNFFVHTFKPRVVIKTLENTYEPKDQLFDVCINQDYELDVNEDCLLEDKSVMLLNENRYLRASNKQLYDTNMMFVREKLNIDK